MGGRARVLVVDADVSGRQALAEQLSRLGHAVETASQGFKALAKLETFHPEVVLAAARMPGMSGMELLERIREIFPTVGVVLVAQEVCVSQVVEAMRKGASDYLQCPVSDEDLSRSLAHARCRARAAEGSEGHEGPFLGNSPPMQRVAAFVRRIGPARASVLVTGESGTGKEIVAESIHRFSPRASGPLVKVHCAALAETLLESELFGHERGAFTGAVERRSGRFESAHGGTLFLDEIGELSPTTQVKLLRFLQEREFQRVGGNETIRVDVRIVAATNRDLLTEVQEGRFREDLFYRLNVVHVHLPPLRERTTDILPLAEKFLARFARQNHKAITGFTDAAVERLLEHRWPGNVRELENTVERAVVTCEGSRIDVADLGLGRPGDDAHTLAPPIPGSTLGDIERYAILATLEHAGGSTRRAARILGISPRKIQYKLHEYSR